MEVKDEEVKVRQTAYGEYIVQVPVKAWSEKQARFFVFRKLYGVEFKDPAK